MLNILTSAQIREADQYTIAHQQISSIGLMESAAKAFVEVFTEEFPDYDSVISVYCGTGNNGGDGLAIARLLKEYGYEQISVKVIRFSPRSSPDFDANLKRLKSVGIQLKEINDTKFPVENADIIIDALLGSGLNRPLSGDWGKIVDYINHLNRNVIAVDIPTGFPSEGIMEKDALFLKANLVITFQRPKINFFLPESAKAMNRFIVADIGLDESHIESFASQWKLIEDQDIQRIFKPRGSFSHKGTYGHALIIAGSKETMGAALLCAEACLYSGAGLTTACIPLEGLTALNVRSPEVMARLRSVTLFRSKDHEKYTSIAAGPGLGTDESSKKIIEELLQKYKEPLVLDADALNILALNPEWLLNLHENSIITPHLKEFDRLFGDHQNWWNRLEKAQRKASELKIVIVLKNRYTFIIAPDKQIYINPTGSPAMSTGGMGDVLTGMIVSFLAQGYSSIESAIFACYIHGKTGEDLSKSMEVVPAGYLLKRIPETIRNYITPLGD